MAGGSCHRGDVVRAVNRGGGPGRVGADLPGAGTGNGLWRGEAGEAGQQDVVDQRAQCGGGDGPLVDQGAEQDVGGQHIPQVVADGLLGDLPPGGGAAQHALDLVAPFVIQVLGEQV